MPRLLSIERVKSLIAEGKTPIKCPHCGDERGTKSDMILVSCSSCGLKINIEKNKIKLEN